MNLPFRAHMLTFLNQMMNEVQMYEVDEDESLFCGEPEVIEAIEQTIPVLERMAPALQAIDEVMNGDITPALFLHKWNNIIDHFQFPDCDDSEISQGVKDFLDRVSKRDNEGEEA